jgi:hypothetical protein
MLSTTAVKSSEDPISLLYQAPRSAEKSPASLLPHCLWDGALRAGAEQVKTLVELKPVILGIS